MRFGKPCPDCERLRAANESLGIAFRSLQDANIVERDRYERLVKETLELRRMGFNPPEPQQAMPEIEMLDPLVEEAIDARSFDKPSRRVLERYARRLMRAKAEPERIAAEIWDGETGDGG